ncbi:cysteine peptidase family C39 domain-containing protein [Aquipseudomonas alcaligenes]|nr:cysteine peptidase family C39 domain-containing protein [Pseudomonas alcaligenes]
MQRVTQIDSTGCGLACVAMLAQTNYKTVKARAIKSKILNPSGPFYTSSKDLRELLSEFKIKTRTGRAIKKWESLPNRAIAGINYKEKTKTWHWVVFIRKDCGESYVLDPKPSIKTKKRNDFGRMRLRSYIPVGV